MKCFGLCSAERKGEIRIDTEKPVYSAGETVRGIVYVCLHQPEPCNAIQLTISGIENMNRFVVAKKNELFSGDIVLLQVAGGTLNPDNYVFPFHFTLPSHLPGSNFMKPGSCTGASIQYVMKALLQIDRMTADLFTSRDIVIQGLETENIEPVEMEMVESVKFMGFQDRGKISLKANLEKNSFTRNETATIRLKVVNSANVKCSELKFKLLQKLKIGGKEYVSVLNKVTFPGVRANDEAEQDQPVPLISKKQPFHPTTISATLCSCSYTIQVTCAFAMCPDMKMEIPIRIFETPIANTVKEWQNAGDEKPRSQEVHIRRTVGDSERQSSSGGGITVED